jgi:hypothetical protein
MTHMPYAMHGIVANRPAPFTILTTVDIVLLIFNTQKKALRRELFLGNFVLGQRASCTISSRAMSCGPGGYAARGLL